MARFNAFEFNIGKGKQIALEKKILQGGRPGEFLDFLFLLGGFGDIVFF
jgi:hypothetical protein